MARSRLAGPVIFLPMTGDSGNAPLFIGHDAVRSALESGSAVAALRAVYALPHGSATSPPRTVARDGGARLRTLSAVLPSGDVMGAKILAQPTSAPSTYLIALFDQRAGKLIALLDAEAITAARTGATSALAVDEMTPEGPLRLGILGAGAEARSHVHAIASVRPLESVRVFSPTPASREAFAAEITQKLGVEAQALSSPREVVEASSTVVCAARSRGEVPVFDGSWLSEGTLVASVGSTLPEQRELDVTALERAKLIVADAPEEVLDGSGDCIAAVEAGFDLAAKTIALNELIRKAEGSDIDHTAINIFKSVGSAIQDLAVAKLVLDRATAHGDAEPLPIHLTPKGT